MGGEGGEGRGGEYPRQGVQQPGAVRVLQGELGLAVFPVDLAFPE